MHEVRADFYDRSRHPATTMLGVADLVAEEALVELEAEAGIPDDWTVEVVSADEE